MSEETLKITCDKCKGDGLMYSDGAYVFFRQWRIDLGLSQVEVATALGMKKEQLSRYEKGKTEFSEGRKRELAKIYSYE